MFQERRLTPLPGTILQHLQARDLAIGNGQDDGEG
jgi:hypothetical protein